MAGLSVEMALSKAKSHARRGEIQEAKKLYQAVLQKYPKNQRAQLGLADLSNHGQSISKQEVPQKAIKQLVNLYDQGRLTAVVEQATRLTARYKESFFVWNLLGAANKGLGRFNEASLAFKKVTELNPTYAAGFNNLGVSLQNQGKFEDSFEAYNRAIFLKPNYAEAYNNLGNALAGTGKLEKAIEAYDQSLTIKPDYAAVHRSLSMLVKYAPSDPHMAAVSELIKCPDIDDEGRCHLYYAAAKMNEDVGHIEDAFNYYSAGGALRKKSLSYDPRQDELIFAQIKNAAPNLKNFKLKVKIKPKNIIPIFIVGMPRSGTTLVEQIISSHSKVHGGGELPFLENLGGKLTLGAKEIHDDDFLYVRDSYLKDLGKISCGKNFVTDKMPQNFLQIALISKALPEAKIVHVKRDPAATCWSNFKQYFPVNGLGYSYDLNDTVAYYNLYLELMGFWKHQYGDQIYCLDYDKLTIEQEFETRKLIEHLEIGWEDACLLPQKNNRGVLTASQQQVREKVYKGSSKAWHKFEPYLNGAFDQFLN